ncbi:MAG: MerC domain-containing protein [Bdellovibrionia bacterium]
MPSASISASLSQKNAGSRLWAAWDGAGAFASFLCMIHCVGVPLILAAFPGLASALPLGAIKDEAFHQIVAVIAAVLALSAFSKGYRQHHSRRVIVLGILGCALLFIAASGIEHETAWTVVGSVLLISAHLDNYRKVHAHTHVHGHAHHGHAGHHH